MTDQYNEITKIQLGLPMSFGGLLTEKLVGYNLQEYRWLEGRCSPKAHSSMGDDSWKLEFEALWISCRQLDELKNLIPLAVLTAIA